MSQRNSYSSGHSEPNTPTAGVDIALLRKFALGIVTGIIDMDNSVRGVTDVPVRRDLRGAIMKLKELPFAKVFEALDLDFPIDTLLRSTADYDDTPSKERRSSKMVVFHPQHQDDQDDGGGVASRRASSAFGHRESSASTVMDDTPPLVSMEPTRGGQELQSHASLPHFLGVSACDDAILPKPSKVTASNPLMLNFDNLDDERNPAAISTTSEYEIPNSARSHQDKDIEYTDTVKKETGDDGLKTINNYVILQELGRGQYGKVKLAAIGDSNRMRAIKIVPKSRLKRKFIGGIGSAHPSSDSLKQNQNARLHREVEIMKNLKHPNIVRLCEVIDDPNSNKLYLVMQYIERGPILNLDKKGTCVPMNLGVAKSYMKQLIEAVMYLHNRGICHRDIKPDNILLGASGLVYIGDFGVSGMFAGDVEPEFADDLKATKGTPLFLAPEEFLDEDDPNRSDSNVMSDADHSTALDIWALGLTFYVMLSGKLPFDPQGGFTEIGNRIRDVHIDFSPEAVGLSEPDPLSPRGAGGPASNLSFGRSVAGANASMACPKPNELDDDLLAFSMCEVPNPGVSCMLPTDEELAMDLISNMLVKDPHLRMTILEARQHPFISATARRKMESEFSVGSSHSSRATSPLHNRGGGGHSPLHHAATSGTTSPLVGPKITPRRVQQHNSRPKLTLPGAGLPLADVPDTPIVYVPPESCAIPNVVQPKKGSAGARNSVEVSAFDIMI